MNGLTRTSDPGLLAFEAARREAQAAGIDQRTPVDSPALIELLRRAGALEPDPNVSPDAKSPER
jgi:hypothetical protein